VRKKKKKKRGKLN